MPTNGKRSGRWLPRKSTYENDAYPSSNDLIPKLFGDLAQDQTVPPAAGQEIDQEPKPRIFAEDIAGFGFAGRYGVLHDLDDGRPRKGVVC